MGRNTILNERLLKWYADFGRALPWRGLSDPYPLWVSEVMLQQTRVATVLPYFDRWMRELPTVSDLAQCSERKLLSLWQGLGYYRRAKLLQEGAKFVVEHGWPESYEDWMRVPGVGDYSASAMMCNVHLAPIPSIDGNGKRVFARLMAHESAGPALLLEARAWGFEQISQEDPVAWNQAIMELGATVCLPKTPRCGECPIREFCIAFQTGTTDQFPTKSPKRQDVDIEFTVVVPYFDGRFGVRLVSEGDWWLGLLEFPRASQHEFDGLEDLGVVTAAVTHHKVHFSCWLSREKWEDEPLEWLTLAELSDAPLSAPMRRILKRATSLLGLE